MPTSRPPFELHVQTVPSSDGTAQTFYGYTLNPESGVPSHWCGRLRTTGCPTEAAAERFVRQRIEELKRGAPGTRPWSDCSALLDDPKRLRSVAAERGYLFFRGLLPAETVLEVRHDVLGVLRDHGALADGSETDAGIAKPGLVLEGSNPTDQYRAYYNQVLSVHSFNALPHHPRIMAVVSSLSARRCWSTRDTSATPSSRDGRRSRPLLTRTTSRSAARRPPGPYGCRWGTATRRWEA